MADKEKIVWFVEPLDTASSEMIQKALDEKTKRTNEMTIIPCAEELVWEVPNYKFVEYLKKSKKKGMYPFGYLDFNTHYLMNGIYRPYRLQDSDIRKASRKRMIKKAA